MKVATLSLEMTSHSQRLTPKISAGTSTFMSCFTGVWHDSRQPSRASPRVKWPSSAGIIDPPPSMTRHRHWAHVPPPPHADDRKIPDSASVASSLPPALAVITFSGSPLISIDTSPELTSCLRANRMTKTSAMMTPVNMLTPRIISVVIS